MDHDTKKDNVVNLIGYKVRKELKLGGTSRARYICDVLGNMLSNFPGGPKFIDSADIQDAITYQFRKGKQDE
jgi:hypothetical protein